MNTRFRMAAFAALAVSLPTLAIAQDPPPPNTKPAPDKNAPDTPSIDTKAAPATAPQISNSPIIGTPNLTVATVKMQAGLRASKLIGAAVFNSANQQIGTMDDLILDTQNKASLAVISVGGFLGVGGKLVAVPYSAVHVEGAKVVLPDGTKNALDKMPGFTYTG